EIDSLGNDFVAYHTELIRGVLAGNVFDWGAKQALDVFANENPGSLQCFRKTMEKIPPRPWIVDSLDDWLDLVKDPVKRPRNVLIFTDNSGADVILGILPLARAVLSEKWAQGGEAGRVFLVANKEPAINDVTKAELSIIMRKACALDPTLEKGLNEKRLFLLENGQSSPCLDFRFVSQELRDVALREKIDLMILEGMGRAIHTNLSAEFSVNCLKIAVIKNRWMAERLGGKLFSVVMKLEKAPLHSIQHNLEIIHTKDSHRASSAPPQNLDT
ncbi:Pantothenate kinase 4, partial [Cichlidogyrus casuarinus]